MAWKKLAFTDEMLTNPMTEDLNMAGNNIIGRNDSYAAVNNSYITIVGGTQDYYGSAIAFYGKDAGTPGVISLNVPNAANDNWIPVLYCTGCTDTPSLYASYGLDMSTKKITSLLAGTAAADAIRKDQALLLNGTQAMTAALDMNDNNIEDMCALKAHDALGIAVFDSGNSDRIVLCPTGYGFLTNAPVDMNKQEIEAMCFENLASAPATPGAAQIYYDTVDDHLYVNVV